MFYRLLLLFLTSQLTTAYGQKTYEWALNSSFEVNSYAKATPGYLSMDLFFNQKRSIYSVGYSFPIYQAQFDDNDEITPISMRIPTLNVSYTFKFIQPPNDRSLSLGATIGYKFGHWRTVDSTFNYYYASSLDTSIEQVSRINISEKRESDQHHFYLGLHCEYPVNSIRFMASFGVGLVFRSSYHFNHETTYYTKGPSTQQFFYKDLTPFGYLSRSWYAKVGVIVPFSVFRSLGRDNSSE